MSTAVRQTGRSGVRRVEKSNLGRENCYTKPERLECASFPENKKKFIMAGEKSIRGQMDRARGRYSQGAGNAGPPKPQVG